MRSEFINIRGLKKIGIMGGTFNPVHNGHLTIAEIVSDKLSLDKVLFIPAGIPNFKQSQKIAPSKDRLIMAHLATLYNDKFEVSPIELDRKNITYTFDTIRAVRKLAGDAEIYFIIGSDIIEGFESWYKIDELFKLCKFILVGRVGYKPELINKKLEFLRKTYNADIEAVEIPRLDISSTEIRNKAENNISIKYLVPDSVEKYILKNNLYKKDVFEDYIKSELEKYMSKYRLTHTLGVASEAVALAKIHGADTKKAALAAYFHDLAKEFPKDEMKSLCLKYKIEVDDITDKQIDIAHGFVSAELARDYYGIFDEEILDAVRYHTTGRKNMTLLDKIIYIADATEPNRRSSEIVEKLRKLVYYDLDKAVMTLLEFTIKNIESRGKKPHSLSEKALKSLIE